eukprot:Gregarina_sp_Poly_1__10507@NODE_770_length_6346_cov_91_421086_g567_i0_p5_GENE_NODE_770_length_6346_cov_91_421086_g567_i0NODE_770_length_6346_cov_91_421086_g567_i0_p5_ORF_typecomplete_len122_score8_17RhoGEF67_u1/PF16615_5/1_8e04RhoGEF67_u1/PF16615_5/1_8_NODE_770_length_6346_cov_91_421086_g567_i011221487
MPFGLSRETRGSLPPGSEGTTSKKAGSGVAMPKPLKWGSYSRPLGLPNNICIHPPPIIPRFGASDSVCRRLRVSSPKSNPASSNTGTSSWSSPGPLFLPTSTNASLLPDPECSAEEYCGFP